MYESIKALKIERRGPVLWVTLDNPPLNGTTPEMHTELAYVFREISRDPETRAVVLTGAGDRGFSAGGDINRMAEGLDDHGRWCNSMPEAREIILNILECDKPVIGRINGHAIGLGASIALSCDITIMVETAKIADTHVKVGLVAGDGGSLLWPHLIGWMQAKRYLLTGDMLTGREAADIGLVTFAVPQEELDAKVDEWAQKLANGPTRAIALTKRSLNMAIRHEGQIFMDAQLGLETMSHLSEDHREAVLAFRDKREPQFTGR
jgi:enoyl-CoA hydratase